MENEAVFIAIVAGGGTLLGVCVTQLFELLKTRVKEKQASRRMRVELIIKAALEDWKQGHQDAERLRAKIMPLDNFIAHYALILDCVLEEDFDIGTLKEALKKSDSIIQSYYEHDAKAREKLAQ